MTVFLPYSVLMSVYARESAAFLTMSLNSMMAQSIPPQEIVLVEDGLITSELNEIFRTFIVGAQPYNSGYVGVLFLVRNRGALVVG